jgi:hypothetical protein
MKKNIFKFTLILFSLSLLGEEKKLNYLQVPGGALFREPRKLVIPEGQTVALAEDTRLKLDRLEVHGTLYTNGHLFHAYIGKLIMGEKGLIKTYEKAAPNSEIKLEPPAPPAPASDQGKECTGGHGGAPGDTGKKAEHDPATDGRKDPQPIILFAAEIQGALKIEAFGQDGGKGTQGGPGAQGGQGGRGGKADGGGLFGMGSCGAGQGGKGGPGGAGGPGGPGGTGGPAPKVEVYLANNLSPDFDLSQTVVLREGAGGAGGDAGVPGKGGAGGGGGAGDGGWVVLGGGGENGGNKGAEGAEGPKTAIAGIQGNRGVVPTFEDRFLRLYSDLEKLRHGVFAGWQEFHWRRHLLAHVEDSFRLVLSQARSRKRFADDLGKEPDLLKDAKAKNIARILKAWNEAFIAPLEEVLKTSATTDRIEKGLETAREIVRLLEGIQARAELGTLQSQVDALLNGNEGVLQLNLKQVESLMSNCAIYNKARADEKYHDPFIHLYFQIPSCEGDPDFTKSDNFFKDIVLSLPVETEIQPKIFEETLITNKMLSFLGESILEKIFLKLRSLVDIVPMAYASVEHPFRKISLVPFSVKDVQDATTSNRDNADKGVLSVLTMKEEEDVSYLNFYQELRAFAVMTGAQK